MRIIIDMQGAQSNGSRTRGVGRYTMSLCQAILRHRSAHEIILALNGLFPETIEPIRAAFHGLLPQENIRVFDAPGPADCLSTPQWRQDIAEHIREHFVASLKPDVVLISSLFEGLVDSAVTSVGRISRHPPTAVILYDLIPYIHQKLYLTNPIAEKWYLKKVDHLRRADLLLSISESSRREAVRYLGLDERSVINISTAVDARFSPRTVPASRRDELRERYGLERPLVMYTGGIDHRKNIEGLIRAYAGLQREIREQYQLAVICSVQDNDRRRLMDLAQQAGLAIRDLIITGFISDEDLIDLYNLCTVFVFPSWHEGFGLPALEAMSCGAPVIAANTSSLPELIGREDALFNPHDEGDITAKLSQVLTDQAFRQAVAQTGLEQARQFSWDSTAKRALCALEQRYAMHAPRIALGDDRPRLAFVSPLPPERSGISDYSAELLPQLSRHYHIEVVVAQQAVSDPYIKAVFPIRNVEWFRKNAHKYDRVLYHFGNSSFHQHMFELLKEIPGVVVLHDFFISGIVAHMDDLGLVPNGLATELYNSHGYEAVRQRFHADDPRDVIWRYPCNLSILQQAQGIIVHSANSLRLAEQWECPAASDWAVIPHLRDSPISPNAMAARKALGYAASDFLVCSFGLLAPTKLNQRLLEAWLQSRLARAANCYLFFVGENLGGDYGEKLVAAIQRSGMQKNIRITGWVDRDVYRQYLAAADLGVQLRTHSRGETPGTVFDCMNYGLPTIVNANGSMADLDDDAVCKLPDDFTDAQLIEALDTLCSDAELRKRLGNRARQIIVEKHNPASCARQYRDAIERFSMPSASGPRALASVLLSFDYAVDDAELIRISEAVSVNTPRPFGGRQLLVDVSGLVGRVERSNIADLQRGLLREWLLNAPSGIRVEPVYATENSEYRYARRFTLDLLNCPRQVLEDDVVEFWAGDIFIGLSSQPAAAERQFYQRLRRYGVQLYFIVYDDGSLPHIADGAPEDDSQWVEAVGESDGVLCMSKDMADRVSARLKASGLQRQRPLKIDWLHPGSNPEIPVSAEEVPAHAAADGDLIRDIAPTCGRTVLGRLLQQSGIADVAA